jgi:hypothetical protein
MSDVERKVIIDVTGKQAQLFTIGYEDIYTKVTDGVPSTNPNEQAFYSEEYGKITHR